MAPTNRSTHAWQISSPLKSSSHRNNSINYSQTTPSSCWQAHPRRASQSAPLSRRALLHAFAHLSLTLPLAAVPAPSTAICGEPDPQFAYFIDWTEDFTRCADGRQIHYRRLGSRKKERKAKRFPVLYIGDGGVALQAGETLELLGVTDRRIVFVDMLGVGESEQLPGGEMLDRREAVRVACDEVMSVLSAVGIGRKNDAMRIHVVAVGFGLEVAEELVKMMRAKEEGAKVASVVAEGWRPVKATDGVLTFEALHGKRVCAEEGAREGSMEMLRALYGEGDVGDVVKRIGVIVPTLALRTLGVESLGAGVEERQLSQVGRLAHLVSTEDAMNEMNSFFEQVERGENKI